MLVGICRNLLIVIRTLLKIVLLYHNILFSNDLLCKISEYPFKRDFRLGFFQKLQPDFQSKKLSLLIILVRLNEIRHL
jgi:hypothetical protein